jgi:hypothetical protein
MNDIIAPLLIIFLCCIGGVMPLLYNDEEKCHSRKDQQTKSDNCCDDPLPMFNPEIDNRHNNFSEG